MPNEKLLEVMGDEVTQEQAFAHANDELTWKPASPLAGAAAVLGCVYIHRRLRRLGWV